MHSSKVGLGLGSMDHKINMGTWLDLKGRQREKIRKLVMFFLGQIKHNWMTSEQGREKNWEECDLYYSL
jgi:hypothetical protein